MEIRKVQLTKEQLIGYFKSNRALFNPPLESRLDIEKYSEKISGAAIHFCAYDNKNTVGFLACYFNDKQKKTGYITSFSVLKQYRAKDIGKQLIEECIGYGRAKGFKRIDLKVFNDNLVAIKFYIKIGFHLMEQATEFSSLTLVL